MGDYSKAGLSSESSEWTEKLREALVAEVHRVLVDDVDPVGLADGKQGSERRFLASFGRAGLLPSMLTGVTDAVLARIAVLARLEGVTWHELGAELRMAASDASPVPDGEWEGVEPKAARALDAVVRGKFERLDSLAVLVSLLAVEDGMAFVATAIALGGLNEARRMRRDVTGRLGGLVKGAGLETVLASANEERQRLGHMGIGTEHLLLGLYSLDGDSAVGILAEFGIDKSEVESEVVASITGLMS